MADMGGVRFVSEDKTDRIIGVVIALCMTAIVAIALLSACSTGYAVSAAIRLHEEGTRKASPSIEAKYHRMLEINDLLKRQQEEMRMLMERQDEEGEDA